MCTVYIYTLVLCSEIFTSQSGRSKRRQSQRHSVLKAAWICTECSTYTVFPFLEVFFSTLPTDQDINYLNLWTPANFLARTLISCNYTMHNPSLRGTYDNWRDS